jgi:hypothetical protein
MLSLTHGPWRCRHRCYFFIQLLIISWQRKGVDDGSSSGGTGNRRTETFREGVSQHLMSAYCMSSPIYKGLHLLKGDRKQIQSSYIAYVIIIIFESRSLASRGFPGCFYTKHARYILDPTKLLRGVFPWRSTAISWEAMEMSHVHCRQEMQWREK